jgi:hypothetical protein
MGVNCLIDESAAGEAASLSVIEKIDRHEETLMCSAAAPLRESP